MQSSRAGRGTTREGERVCGRVGVRVWGYRVTQLSLSPSFWSQGVKGLYTFGVIPGGWVVGWLAAQRSTITPFLSFPHPNLAGGHSPNLAGCSPETHLAP